MQRFGMNFIIGAWLASVMSGLSGTTALAQGGSDSARVMKIIVTSGPGSAPDIIARLLSPKLSEKLSRTVIVENRPGANGSLGAGEVARSDPNGSTILVSTSGTLTANLALYPKSSTELIASLSPVTQVASVDFVIAARKGLGVATLPDLLALVRANPGKITVATGPHGSFPHLAAEMLKQQSKLDVLIVKHQTGPSAVTNTSGGHTDVVIDTAAVLQPVVDAGLLVPLASTGATRDSASPGLPTVAEAGLEGYAMAGWIGVVAPGKTPLAIREDLQKAISDAVADPVIRSRFDTIQFRPIASSVPDFTTFWDQEKARLGNVIRNGGLALE